MFWLPFIKLLIHPESNFPQRDIERFVWMVKKHISLADIHLRDEMGFVLEEKGLISDIEKETSFRWDSNRFLGLWVMDRPL